MKRSYLVGFAALFVVVVASVIAVVTIHKNSNTKNNAQTLHVVAAENFWGSLAAQIGGNRVAVENAATDPNADPHEFASNNATARAFAKADYVILNGAGYDSWGDKLLNANPTPERSVLNIATLLGKNDGDNPHFWYNPDYVNRVVIQMRDDLVALAPEDTDYFDQQLSRLQHSLDGYQARIADIRLQDADVEVAATEDIFAYLADAAGLKLVSPPEFMSAVAEDTDPPTASVTKFHDQLQSKRVKLLIYNKQAATPLTENLKRLATKQGIPVVGITETVQPANHTFQEWMDAQIADIQAALNKNKVQE